MLNTTYLVGDDDDIVVECSAEYGTDLDSNDCLNALTAKFLESGNEIIFVERETAEEKGYYSLPFRWMGSTCGDLVYLTATAMPNHAGVYIF